MKIKGVTEGSGNAKNNTKPDTLDNIQYLEDCDFFLRKPNTTLKNSHKLVKKAKGK